MEIGDIIHMDIVNLAWAALIQQKLLQQDNGQEDLKGIMALGFPRFSQGLAQDPTTCRIWYFASHCQNALVLYYLYIKINTYCVRLRFYIYIYI